MKKYNRNKRGTYRQATRRRTHTHESYDGRDGRTRKLLNKRIHIPMRYDGCNRIEYIADAYKKERDTHAQIHIGVTNAMNEIFPEINAPHNAKTHKGTAPYRKRVITHTDHMPPEHMMKEMHDRYTYTETRRVKCIIYNSEGEMIYTGIFRRTLKTDGEHIHVTLHRADRSIDVKPYRPMNNTIHGVTLAEIYAHDVEIYQI